MKLTKLSRLFLNRSHVKSDFEAWGTFYVWVTSNNDLGAVAFAVMFVWFGSIVVFWL